MSETAGWQEMESAVSCPGRWLVLSVGALFLLIGAIGFFTIGGVAPPGIPFWVAKVGTAIVALLGGVALAWVVRNAISPVHVRHAALEVLPNVPREPVIQEGSVVHGRLTHELCEDAQGWRLGPIERLWRDDKRLLFGFGIPFLVFFSGFLTWAIHDQLKFAGWPVSAICGIMATVVCGGSVFSIIGLMMRSGYRRLSTLTIPRNGTELTLDSPEAPELANADLTEGLKWLFLGETKRHRLTIPREQVAAVQLCPWKFVVGQSGPRHITWAVQGLLVLGCSDEAVYYRLPILLTSDFVGAARLMQRLALSLNVPYLFSADAEGWKTERIRAQKRPPLRAGGSQS